MKKKLQNERGSATIEFLGMVPLVLLIMMVLWQFLVAGYAVIVSQSALNEAAKTYSITDGDLIQANNTATDLIQKAGGNLDSVVVNIDSKNGNDFTLKISANLKLIFVPDSFGGGELLVPLERKISGRVMQ